MGPQNTNLRSFSIGFWNANGLSRRASEFRDFIYNNNLDIILVSETHFSQGNTVKVANYDLFNVDRPRIGNQHSFGGTAVYVKRGFNATVTKVPTLNCIEATPVVLDFPLIPNLLVAAIYISPNARNNLLEQDLNRLINRFPNFILAGDYNAHHPSWNNRYTNRRGIELRRWVDQNFAQIIVPPEPTFPASNNYLDLAITRNFPYPYSIQTLNDLSSDHLPVLLRYDVGSYDLDLTTALSTSWEDYGYVLDQRELPSLTPETPLDVEQAISMFGETLHDVFSQCSKPRRGTGNTMVLPPDIRELIRERNRARRDWQVFRSPHFRRRFNRLQRRVHAAIKEFSTTRWNNFVGSLSTENNTIWKATSRIRRTRTHIPAINCPINGMAYTNTQKAEAIAESLRSQFTPHLDLSYPRVESEINDTVQNYLHCTSFNTLPLASPDEIQEYISGLKKNKAPGIDRISTNMLIYLPPKFIFYLTVLINRMLILNYFPECWKKAIVVPIPKGGLDSHTPSNFRPISLLSCLSKVYESVLAHRLDDFLDSHGVLIPEQFGFRARHSTQHQLWRVTEKISEGFLLGNVTGIIFLDVQKAFDKVWHSALLYKLIRIGAPHQLVKIIANYLSNRTFSVRVCNSYSDYKPILSSVPQGSLLGPKLYNIYINDMPKMPDVDLAIFADDTAIMYTHRNTNTVFEKLQQYLNEYLIWLRHWKIKVNSAKSAAIFFTRRRFSPNANFKIHNDPIPWESSYKYLGIHLDSKLIWKLHISKTIEKAEKASFALKSLLAWNSRLSIKNKLLLYKSMIRPILTYGSMVFGAASKHQIERLQIFQNKLLRRFVRATVYVRNDVIHKDLNIRPIFHEIKNLAIRFHRSIPNVGNPVLNSIRRYPPTLGRGSKRPLSIIYRDDDFVPPSKRIRTSLPSAVT